MASTAQDNIAAPRIDPVKRHRREVLWRVVMPVALPGIGLLGFAVMVYIAALTGSVSGAEVGVISNLLLITFVLCPMVILCLIPYAFFAVLAIGAGMGYRMVSKPAHDIRAVTDRVLATTRRLAPRVAQPFTALNVRMSRWEATVVRLLGAKPNKDGADRIASSTETNNPPPQEGSKGS